MIDSLKDNYEGEIKENVEMNWRKISHYFSRAQSSNYDRNDRNLDKVLGRKFKKRFCDCSPIFKNFHIIVLIKDDLRG